MKVSDPHGAWLEPSPVSPSDSTAFALLAGTIRQTWDVGFGAEVDETMFVAPGMMIGTSCDLKFEDRPSLT